MRRDGSVTSWIPEIEYDDQGGTLKTAPRPAPKNVEADPDEKKILQEFDLDPAKWTVTSVRRSRWQQREGGEWLEAYRCTFARRGTVSRLSESDVEKILGRYASQGPLNTPKAPTTHLVPVGDLQIGKPDGGGTPAVIERFCRLTKHVERRLIDEGGTRRLILPWLGDCIEGYLSQAGKNAGRVDVSITEQVRLYRRLMMHQIATLAPLADYVLVPVIPGNHDEAYRELNTGPGDSWAIEGASAVAEALHLSGKFPHVQFLFPEDEELVITVDVGTKPNPYILAFTHGHLWRPGQVERWWEGQMKGRQKAGAADMLFSAHLHHFHAKTVGSDRHWFQIPALDGGSDWFRRAKGDDASAGMVAMEITPQVSPGWRNLTIYQ